MRYAVLCTTLLFVAMGALTGCLYSASEDEGPHNEVILANYACENGETLPVRFEGESALATLGPDKTILLTQKRAASGIWYAADGYELRGKGTEASWTVYGQQTFCDAG